MRIGSVIAFSVGQIEPGDVVCFHMLTLHASAGVEGSRRRRVFSVRFLGDDIVHAPR